MAAPPWVTAAHRVGRASWLAMSLGVAAVGCGLPLSDAPVPTSNRCVDDADCSDDGVCLVEQELCVSEVADLDPLLAEVFVPQGSSAEQGGTSSLLEVSVPKGRVPGGIVLEETLVTRSLATVTGRLTVDDPACAEALAADGFFPITLELRPTDAPTNLSLPSFGLSSDDTRGELALRVPVGGYDITIRPASAPPNPGDGTSACILPPALFRNQTIGGDFNIDLGLESRPVEQVGLVRGLDVDRWTVDLIDREQGRVISDLATLGAPTPEEGVLSTAYTLRYWQDVVTPADGSTLAAFLRLSPPADLQAAGFPTVLSDLNAGATFDLGPLAAAESIPVQASVIAGDTGLASRVFIQSQRFLDGEMGNTVFFKAEVRTDAAGVLEIPLFSGIYSFTAVPDDPAFAATERTIELGENDLGGKTLLLQPKVRLAGEVRTANGLSAFGLGVSVDSVGRVPQSFVASRLTPRAISVENLDGETDAEGRFSFDVPPGQYDLSIRPPSESGLPWAVLSQLAVDDATPTLGVGLTDPVIMVGRVATDEGTPIPGAVIRLWARRNDPEAGDDEDDSVFQVAEGSADDEGRYQLYLPASLNRSLTDATP
ncbi:MAG: hypothetical protein AAF928_10855 [Myxococcota bacterium]